MKNSIIIFDLDGTLVDSASDLFDSLNNTFIHHGIPACKSTKASQLVGGGGRVMIERALALQQRAAPPNLVNTLYQDFLSHYAINMPGKTQFFPGSLPCLDALQQAGYALALCTNKSEHLARLLLEKLGEANRFIALCGGDSFPYKKPDKRHILSTLSMASHALSDKTKYTALMVGDSAADIQAAKGAGIPVVAIDFGYSDIPVKRLNPTRTVSHFNELTPTFVAQLLQAP